MAFTPAGNAPPGASWTHRDGMARHELGGLHGLAVVGDPQLDGRRFVAAEQLLEEGGKRLSLVM